jgi:predicted DNA-binding transcriptional regulator AlpA
MSRRDGKVLCVFLFHPAGRQMEIKLVRKVMRRPAVLAATGWSEKTLERKIKDKVFPPGIKIDPAARARVWFEDDVEAFQNAAIDAATQAAA